MKWDAYQQHKYMTNGILITQSLQQQRKYTIEGILITQRFKLLAPGVSLCSCKHNTVHMMKNSRWEGVTYSMAALHFGVH